MTDSTAVPATLHPYVRSGVIAEARSAVDLLSDELERDAIDPQARSEAFEYFDATRALLDTIELALAPGQQWFTLDLRRSPQLVLDALRSIHRTEVQRLQNAAADRRHIPPGEVEALGDLVATVEQIVAPDATVERPSRAHRVVPRAVTRPRDAQ